MLWPLLVVLSDVSLEIDHFEINALFMNDQMSFTILELFSYSIISDFM